MSSDGFSRSVALIIRHRRVRRRSSFRGRAPKPPICRSLAGARTYVGGVNCVGGGGLKMGFTVATFSKKEKFIFFLWQNLERVERVERTEGTEWTDGARQAEGREGRARTLDRKRETAACAPVDLDTGKVTSTPRRYQQRGWYPCRKDESGSSWRKGAETRSY